MVVSVALLVVVSVAVVVVAMLGDPSGRAALVALVVPGVVENPKHQLERSVGPRMYSKCTAVRVAGTAPSSLGRCLSRTDGGDAGKAPASCP